VRSGEISRPGRPTGGRERAARHAFREDDRHELAAARDSRGIRGAAATHAGT
jgi:hypothetical protein